MTVRTLERTIEILAMEETPPRLLARATFSIDIHANEMALIGFEAVDRSSLKRLWVGLDDAWRQARTWSLVKLKQARDEQLPADHPDVSGPPQEPPKRPAPGTCFYAGHAWQQDAKEAGRDRMNQKIKHYRCGRYGCDATMTETLTEKDGGPRWETKVTEAAA